MAGLQLFVALDAAPQFLAQQRREIRIGVGPEPIELDDERLHGAMDIRASRRLAEHRAGALARTAKITIAREIDEYRFSRIDVGNGGDEPQLVARPSNGRGVDEQVVARAR